MGMGQFKKRGNAKSPITAVITAVITAREYYREAPWFFSSSGRTYGRRKDSINTYAKVRNFGDH